MKNLNVLGDSPEIEYAEEMVLDESGFDLLIDDNIVISGSFENLDPFELAYRVLPEDPDLPDYYKRPHQTEHMARLFEKIKTEDIQAEVFLFLQELARRGGYLK